MASDDRSPEPTIFRVPIDDETMIAVIEQAQETKTPPRDLIAAVVRSVFLYAQKSG